MSIDIEEDHASAAAARKPRSALDLAAIRTRLAQQRGRQYWRSLDELADTPEFEAYLKAEFPEQATQLLDPVGRRTFMKLMGASLALAGVSACTRQPTEKVFPYVKAPELIVPGEPLFFATAMPLAGIGTGLLAESHMGRPTKVEGNPDHPASLGATDLYSQASVLGLYDPDRSQVIRQVGDVQTWANFTAALAQLMAAQKTRDGAGLRILTGTVTSPTLAAQMRQLLTQYPQAKWHQWEPVSRDAARTATRRAFGRPLDTQYRFDRALRVLSLDADFLGSGPDQVRCVRDYVSTRRDPAAMSRLYVIETAPSNTGAMADHRLPLRPDEIAEFAIAVARGVGVSVRAPQGMTAHATLIDAVVQDLKQHSGSAIVLAGQWAAPGVHLLAHAINQALANVGTTVFYTAPVDAEPVDHTESLRELVEAMDAGQVQLLVMADTNPVYAAPADLRFAERLAKVGTRIHYGLYVDETAELSHWHVPATHYLESWSDVRAYDGTVTVIQPLIAPLYEGRTPHELLSALLGAPEKTSYDLLRDYWKTQLAADDFEAQWRKAVHDGVVAGSALPALRPNWVSKPGDWDADVLPPPAAREADALEIAFRPDPTVFDGRFANNAWLQEVPKALSRLTWDNTAQVAPATAERLGIGNEDVVELELDGRTVRAPVWIAPGQAPGVITVHLGYGRTRAGQVGTDVGFNAYGIRPSDRPWSAPGLVLRKTGAHYPLSCTQHHHSMEGRDLARLGTVDEYRADPHFAATHSTADESMFPPYRYDGYAWGMTVDLNTCVGCNACVTACQAENNVPVVGKEQVGRGREMHWIRIDRYYAGDLDNPEIIHQPVYCQHCQLAPCETVCPVNATVHDHEGLNAMVYNRCVGTRYCSNNCPYKVRRFNFTLWQNPQSDVLKMVFNPDVTVRSRGVMEKCTYCVQRINYARIRAQREDRQIRDGELLSACQQACPAEALTFGNINDPEAKVTKLKQDPRNYALLNELGTQPRTTYLAGLRNPNPEIEAKGASTRSARTVGGLSEEIATVRPEPVEGRASTTISPEVKG
jgi:molybdopterin-containing oxidoreductase family iron-sulfur binding subunit